MPYCFNKETFYNEMQLLAMCDSSNCRNIAQAVVGFSFAFHLAKNIIL